MNYFSILVKSCGGITKSLCLLISFVLLAACSSEQSSDENQVAEQEQQTEYLELDAKTLKTSAVQTTSTNVTSNATATFTYPAANESISGGLLVKFTVTDTEALTAVYLQLGEQIVLTACEQNCGTEFSALINGINPSLHGWSAGTNTISVLTDTASAQSQLAGSVNIDWQPLTIEGLSHQYDADNGTISLSWQADEQMLRYNAYVASEPGILGQNINDLTGGEARLALTTTSVTFSNKPNNNNYYVRVSGIDGSGESAFSEEIAIVNLTDTPTPITSELNLEVDSGEVLVGNLLEQVTISDDSELTIDTTPETDVTNGQLTLNEDGSFSYQSNADFVGNDSFVYLVNSANGTSNTGTVNISVNEPTITLVPVVTDSDVSEIANQTVAGNLLSNASIEDNSTLTVGSVTASAGTIEFESTGEFTYTPQVGFIGDVTIDFIVFSAYNTQTSGTFTITYLPIPSIEAFDIALDTEVNTALNGNVLDTVFISDNSELTVTATPVTSPTNGQLTLSEDGSFTYTPNNDYLGEDTFEFEVNSIYNTSETAVVTINVTPKMSTFVGEHDFNDDTLTDLTVTFSEALSTWTLNFAVNVVAVYQEIGSQLLPFERQSEEQYSLEITDSSADLSYKVLYENAYYDIKVTNLSSDATLELSPLNTIETDPAVIFGNKTFLNIQPEDSTKLAVNLSLFHETGGKLEFIDNTNAKYISERGSEDFDWQVDGSKIIITGLSNEFGDYFNYYTLDELLELGWIDQATYDANINSEDSYIHEVTITEQSAELTILENKLAFVTVSNILNVHYTLPDVLGGSVIEEQETDGELRLYDNSSLFTYDLTSPANTNIALPVLTTDSESTGIKVSLATFNADNTGTVNDTAFTWSLDSGQLSIVQGESTSTLTSLGNQDGMSIVSVAASDSNMEYHSVTHAMPSANLTSEQIELAVEDKIVQLTWQETDENEQLNDVQEGFYFTSQDAVSAPVGEKHVAMFHDFYGFTSFSGTWVVEGDSIIIRQYNHQVDYEVPNCDPEQDSDCIISSERIITVLNANEEHIWFIDSQTYFQGFDFNEESGESIPIYENYHSNGIFRYNLNSRDLTEDDIVNINEDDFNTIIDVLGNDSSSSDLTLISAEASIGSAFINESGQLEYFTPFNYFGTETITYWVEHNDGTLSAGSVDVTINGVNDAPAPMFDHVVATNYQSIIIDINSVFLANDIDDDGDTISFVDGSLSATNGIVVENNDGTFTYTPKDNSTSDSLFYKITDGTVEVDSFATVDVLDASLVGNHDIDADGVIDLMISEPNADEFNFELYAPASNFFQLINDRHHIIERVTDSQNYIHDQFGPTGVHKYGIVQNETLYELSINYDLDEPTILIDRTGSVLSKDFGSLSTPAEFVSFNPYWDINSKQVLNSARLNFIFAGEQIMLNANNTGTHTNHSGDTGFTWAVEGSNLKVTSNDATPEQTDYQISDLESLGVLTTTEVSDYTDGGGFASDMVTVDVTEQEIELEIIENNSSYATVIEYQTKTYSLPSPLPTDSRSITDQSGEYRLYPKDKIQINQFNAMDGSFIIPVFQADEENYGSHLRYLEANFSDDGTGLFPDTSPVVTFNWNINDGALELVTSESLMFKYQLTFGDQNTGEVIINALISGEEFSSIGHISAPTSVTDAEYVDLIDGKTIISSYSYTNPDFILETGRFDPAGIFGFLAKNEQHPEASTGQLQGTRFSGYEGGFSLSDWSWEINDGVLTYKRFIDTDNGTGTCDEVESTCYAYFVRDMEFIGYDNGILWVREQQQIIDTEQLPTEVYIDNIKPRINSYFIAPNLTLNSDSIADVSEDSSGNIINLIDNDLNSLGSNDGLHLVYAAADYGSATINTDYSVNYDTSDNFTGTETLDYIVMDEENGFELGVAMFNVSGVNDQPSITSVATTTATEDVQYTYSAEVSDSDDDNNGSDLTWSLSNEPTGMTVSSTGEVTWTPAEGVVTSGTVTLSVEDGLENGTVPATEMFTITVTQVNDQPSITSVATTSAIEDTLYTYAATVSDDDDSNDGIDLTWSLSNQPTGMSVSSTGVVTWTPTEGVTTSGTVTLTVQDGLEDGVIAATEDFTISVTQVNDQPMITSVATTSATEDVLYTYSPTVSDDDDNNDGVDLSWSLTNEPTGMSVSSTGVVTWTPTEGVTTSGTVTLTVQDGLEDGTIADYEMFTISVTAVNDLPTVADDSYALNEGGSVTFNRSDIMDDAETSVSSLTINTVAAATNGSIVDNNDGTLTYTHDDSETTSDTFVFSVTDADSATSSNNATITFNITAIDEAPVLTADSIFNLAENDDGSLVVNASATDPEGDAYSITVTNDVNCVDILNYFLLDEPSTGQYELKTTGQPTIYLDYEDLAQNYATCDEDSDDTTYTYTVKWKVSQIGNSALYDEQSLQIVVSDVVENTEYHLDTSFGDDGLIEINTFAEEGNDDYVVDAAIDSSGNRFVLVNMQDGGGNVHHVAKLLSDGTFDLTFADNGRKHLEHTALNDVNVGTNDTDYSSLSGFTPRHLKLDESTGKIYVLGYEYDGATEEHGFVMRLNSDGSIDTSFSTDGKYNHDPVTSGDHSRAIDLLLHSDGNLYFASNTRNLESDNLPTRKNFKLAKLTSSGTLVEQHSEYDLVGLSNSEIAAGIVEDSSGNIVVFGSIDQSGPHDLMFGVLEAADLTPSNNSGVASSPDSTNSPHDYNLGRDDFVNTYVPVGTDKVALAGYTSAWDAEQDEVHPYIAVLDFETLSITKELDGYATNDGIDEEIVSISVDSQGNYAFTSKTSPSSGNRQMYINQVDSEGGFTNFTNNGLELTDTSGSGINNNDSINAVLVQDPADTNDYINLFSSFEKTNVDGSSEVETYYRQYSETAELARFDYDFHPVNSEHIYGSVVHSNGAIYTASVRDNSDIGIWGHSVIAHDSISGLWLQSFGEATYPGYIHLDGDGSNYIYSDSGGIFESHDGYTLYVDIMLDDSVPQTEFSVDKVDSSGASQAGFPSSFTVPVGAYILDSKYNATADKIALFGAYGVELYYSFVMVIDASNGSLVYQNQLGTVLGFDNLSDEITNEFTSGIIEDDGSVIALGFGNQDGDNDNNFTEDTFLVRFDAAGNIDASFDDLSGDAVNDNVLTVELVENTNIISSKLEQLSSGDLVYTAESYDGFVAETLLVKLKEDESTPNQYSIDTTFDNAIDGSDSDNFLYMELHNFANPNNLVGATSVDLLVDTNDNVIVIGNADFGAQPIGYLAKFDGSTGDYDSSFGGQSFPGYFIPYAKEDCDNHSAVPGVNEFCDVAGSYGFVRGDLDASGNLYIYTISNGTNNSINTAILKFNLIQNDQVDGYNFNYSVQFFGGA